MLTIESETYQHLLDDALTTFPDECCGFLFGKETADGRVLSDILVVKNAKEGDKRRRFEITPRDYLRAEKYALAKDLELLAVYHSHPKHPAVPSEHDRVAALPFFSYVIVSVQENGEHNTLSWHLNEEAQFEQEPIFEPAAV